MNSANKVGIIRAEDVDKNHDHDEIPCSHYDLQNQSNEKDYQFYARKKLKRMKKSKSPEKYEQPFIFDDSNEKSKKKILKLRF
jgi:hypothetical protein